MHISDQLEALAKRNMSPEITNGWFAESLRLSFFGVTDWTQRALFSEVTDTVAAQINAQPALQIQQEQGIVADAYLTIGQQANRIDLILSDQPTRNTVDPEKPGFRPLFWVDSFGKSIEIFDRITAKTLTIIRGATRVAYAVTVIQQTENIRDAGGILHDCLPTVQFDPKCDVDVSFQINRPIRDQAGRLINRLARWDTIQVTTLRVSVGGVGSLSTVPSAPPLCAARIYADISTDAENTTPFSHPELEKIVADLRGHAIAIVEQGDSHEA
ncbi:MAG TPA: hypothetical protein VFB45_10695 [Pseudolabrys sp.]|nr:hypothetical protein [Pseudolabrys sp.]